MTNPIITLMASVLPLLMFALVPLFYFLKGKNFAESSLHAFFSSLFAWVATYFLKDLFQTTRPYLLKDISPLTLTYPADASFPSTHTASLFALSFSLYLHHPLLGRLFIILSSLVGVSRIIAQVHFPIDILGGAIVGITASYIISHLHPLIKKTPKLRS